MAVLENDDDAAGGRCPGSEASLLECPLLGHCGGGHTGGYRNLLCSGDIESDSFNGIDMSN